MNHENQHGYVDPGPSNPGEVMRLLFFIFGLIIALYLFGMIWYTWGMYWAFGILGGASALGSGVFAYPRISHHRMKVKEHKQEMLDRELKRELSAAALNNDYSVEWEVSDGVNIQRVVLTSPMTIPQGPITQIFEDEEEQQALPPPIVQPSMDEMYSAVRYNALDVAFGKDAETGEIITQNIPNGVHFKLVGSSGFGKSCLAGALLDIATKRNDPDHLRIAMLDLEYKTSRLFEQLPHVLEVQNGTRRVRLHAKDADEVARHLALLRKELDRRAIRQVAAPLLLIYVEEMLSLQYEVDDKLKEQMLADLAILALRGRKYGMFLLACTQTDYSTKELREAQRQFRTRSGFAIDPPAARAAGFINNDLVKYNFQNAKPGRYLFERPAFSRLVLAPLYDVEQKLQEMSNPSRQYVTGSLVGSDLVPDLVPDENGEMPVQPGGNQSELDLVLAARVREMTALERSQNEIIEHVFPGMRREDAFRELRRYMAYLVKSQEV